MKQPAKPPHRQFNLPLLSAPAMVIPDNQRNLNHALVELLMSAAKEGVEPQGNGGGDESEAHG